jgi:hypothetical protein
MLTKPQLARFVHSSGVDDPSFAEKEVVLTYLLHIRVSSSCCAALIPS